MVSAMVLAVILLLCSIPLAFASSNTLMETDMEENPQSASFVCAQNTSFPVYLSVGSDVERAGYTIPTGSVPIEVYAYAYVDLDYDQSSGTATVHPCLFGSGEIILKIVAVYSVPDNGSTVNVALVWNLDVIYVPEMVESP